MKGWQVKGAYALLLAEGFLEGMWWTLRKS